jgi:hypothetical protein
LESQLGDEEVWSARLKERVKMVIAFNSTV